MAARTSSPGPKKYASVKLLVINSETFGFKIF